MGLCLETETEELLIKLTAVLYIGSEIKFDMKFLDNLIFLPIRFDFCAKCLQR
jgi:hypothetical protein